MGMIAMTLIMWNSDSLDSKLEHFKSSMGKTGLKVALSSWAHCGGDDCNKVLTRRICLSICVSHKRPCITKANTLT